MVEFLDKIKFITSCYAADGRVPGWFTGDSYGFHPHGFCADGVLIYDHHNVNKYYTIKICNTPEDASYYPADRGRDASVSYGSNALPRFVNGSTTVWNSGEWSEEGPWKEKIEKLVDRLYVLCREAENDKEKQEHEESERKQQLGQEERNKLINNWK
jgi:hypothetical protein